jgi:GTP cyclohydrolase I
VTNPIDVHTNGHRPPPARAQALTQPEAAERAAADLLHALGADLEAEGLRDTPRRIAQLYAEMLTPTPFTATSFRNAGTYDELIVAREIPFHSLCEHHLLPFVGTAHVGYLPGARILGLSKLARVVDHFARSFQLQERLTSEIADWLEQELDPRGVGVVLEAEHMCMTLRGVQKHGTTTITSALRGGVRDDARTRQEFLALATRARGVRTFSAPSLTGYANRATPRRAILEPDRLASKATVGGWLRGGGGRQLRGDERRSARAHRAG